MGIKHSHFLGVMVVICSVVTSSVVVLGSVDVVDSVGQNDVIPRVLIEAVLPEGTL